MWVLFAVLSVIFTGLNFYFGSKGRNYKPFMALALSFTAMTVCAEYSMISNWAKASDMSAIMDVAPCMSGVLWVFTLIMTALNIIPAFLDR